MLACREIAAELKNRAASALGGTHDDYVLEGGVVRRLDAGTSVSFEQLLDGAPITVEATYRPPPTEPLDPLTGQGHNGVAFMFAAHRATVEVDTDLAHGGNDLGMHVRRRCRAGGAAIVAPLRGRGEQRLCHLRTAGVLDADEEDSAHRGDSARTN